MHDIQVVEVEAIASQRCLGSAMFRSYLDISNGFCPSGKVRIDEDDTSPAKISFRPVEQARQTAIMGMYAMRWSMKDMLIWQQWGDTLRKITRSQFTRRAMTMVMRDGRLK